MSLTTSDHGFNGPRSCGFNNLVDRSHHAVEFGDFAAKLLAACGGQRVEANAAAGFGLAPPRLHPALDEHALERGIKRSLFDAEHILRNQMDSPRDDVAVQR